MENNPHKDQWRVGLLWELVSPSLQVASGVVNISRNPHKLDYKEILSYQIAVKIESGRLSYSAQKDEHNFPKEWDYIKEKVDDIVKAYWTGMCLRKNVVIWVEEFWNLSDEEEGNNLVQDERLWAKT